MDWAVATPDAYHGVLTIEDIAGGPGRTATYLKDDKSGIRFSKNRTVWAPAAGRDGEPSLRVDYQGTAYVGAIRGLTGGNDLWRFDLNADPMMRTATARLDPNGIPFNPAWMGQPDAIAPNNQEDLGGVVAGKWDIPAVGHKPSALNSTGPPLVATTSLIAANVSAQRSTDRGETFLNNRLKTPPSRWMTVSGMNSTVVTSCISATASSSECRRRPSFTSIVPRTVA